LCPLVAIASILFAAAVHSVVERVYRPPGAKTLIDIPTAVITPAVEQTAIDQTAAITDATTHGVQAHNWAHKKWSQWATECHSLSRQAMEWSRGNPLMVGDFGTI